ncbi:MAG: BTAD domain-containing putative transcriptional regulator, partial [Chloroflexota bacterium]
MTRLTLTFLGQFEALLDDTPLVHFRSAKTQALFIYLVMNSQDAQSRSGLAALLWPTDAEQAAKQNLRQAIFRLRQLLGDVKEEETPYLLVTRSSVQFNPASDVQLDITAFHSHLEQGQLEEAAALYRDELLAGFHCDSRPFNNWLRQERETVHWLALETLTTLAGRSLARADYQETGRLARRQLALEPWREEAHRQLMQALALQGDRSAALA